MKDRNYQNEITSLTKCETDCRSELACWGFTFYDNLDSENATSRCVWYNSASVYVFEEREGSDHYIKEGCPQATTAATPKSGK